MGAYDNYKIITDNSAADFQNTVAKVGNGTSCASCGEIQKQ